MTMAEQTEKEEKTNIGNMAMNRTLLELELELPRRQLWDCSDPWGH